MGLILKRCELMKNRVDLKYNIKTKNLSVEKERSIDSKAQKKTNKITKFRINAFL